MELRTLFDQVGSRDLTKRKNAWNTLFQKRSEILLDHSEIQELRTVLIDEEDLDVRSFGTLCLDHYVEWKRSGAEDTLQDWLFKPFVPPLFSAGSAHSPKSAVIAVCDHQHIRDVQPQVMLARFLPSDRYHATEFHQISLRDPQWEPVALDELSAVCFVGRPGMFHNCKLIDALPPELRFSLPADDDEWRGKPLSSESVDRYHHVRQNRPNAGPMFYAAREEATRRTDYALVQRLRINYGGHHVAVLILAGATSLGTCGAA
jgi:hypothetical protein